MKDLLLNGRLIARAAWREERADGLAISGENTLIRRSGSRLYYLTERAGRVHSGGLRTRPKQNV